MTVLTGLPLTGDAPAVLPGDVEPATQLLALPPDPVESATISPGMGTASAVPSDSGPLQPGQAFGSRYRIIRALGVGGMGAVYEAWDAELGVAVAMKLIRPDVMADPTAAAEVERRFKRELLLARQVTHKNVVRIFDLGEIDGIKYITMTYVDGADLATILKREGRLPIPTVMRMARQVVSGLVEAHKAGVVHRDLKPANVMIDNAGDALIMDFGIARSTGGPGVSAPATAQSLPPGVLRSVIFAGATRYGAVVGTVEYMAPEQAKGQEVDQRADIYALGLMLYDMLIGREHRAQHTNSAIAELRARMEQPPPPARSVAPEIPEALNRVISRCLEPDPANRYQTSEELAADLAGLDDDGIPIPIPRRFTPRLIAAAVVIMAVLVTGTWWLTRTPPPPKQHEPLSVVIADLHNTTGDPAFDGTLEQTLKRALEGAGFINAIDRSRIRGILGVRPPDKFDEGAARELASKQGLGVVLSASIERLGGGYEISVKATQTVTGKVIASGRSRASTKDQVLATATKLVAPVRRVLGDDTSESAQMFAMKSVSATSLDVVNLYARAVDAQTNSKYEEARQIMLKAVDLDPKFGLGYQGLAVLSQNLKNSEDAVKYINQALRYVDAMTERERFATRGYYYRLTGDYQQCVKEYGELTARYAADATAHNNRVTCLSKLRHMREAVDEMRQAVQILPKRVLFRSNLAMYADYANDFQTALQEARSIQEPNDMATLAIAFAHLGQGQLQDAAATYQRLQTISARGASWSVSGLGDLALYEGRVSDAVQIFEQGAAAEVSKNPESAARKLTSLAYAHLMRGAAGTGPAVAAAKKALTTSNTAEVRFLAARIFVEAGEVASAQALAAALGAELPAAPRAYGKIIEGGIALKHDNPREAIKALTDANNLLDTWLGHFDLGRAYLQAGAFPQADSEFDQCLKRRGEALALLVDEEPTYSYFPLVYYYQGRVREGMKAEFADSYREYLNIRGKSTEDRLLPEVRRRAGQ